MNKVEITQALLDDVNINLSLKDALTLWWYPNYSINKNNARLTKAGMAVLSKAMHTYEFEFEFENTGNCINQLAKLNTPYYVDHSGHIVIFSSPLATMIKMYPNFARYLELLGT